MLSTRRPGQQRISALLSEQTSAPLSYPSPGMTSGPAPAGWNVGHEHMELGIGRAVYDRARGAVDRWAMFDVGWVELLGADVPPREHQTVVVLARVGPFWSLNACRVTSVVDEPGSSHLYGFAYGTLTEHMESGEERFLVTWDEENDRVSYDVTAYSRPRHLLARLSGPVGRAAQRRFRLDSARAMQRAAAL